MKSYVTIPEEGAYLQFDHAFSFANDKPVYYDGGKVYSRTDDADDWQDLTLRYVSGAPANGFITFLASNPLAGKLAWVGTSYGYVGSRLDLSHLAGQNARFSSLFGSGNSDNDIGWFIDNVLIYSCQEP